MIAYNEPLKLCPQTGKIVITSVDLPVCPGLFLHPARFSFSIEEKGKGVQGFSTHPLLTGLKQQLTDTPEHLQAHLSHIEAQLKTFFSQISVRKGKTPSLVEANQKLQKVASKIFKGMQKSSEKAHLTMLSLHASMLRHLIDQENTNMLGAHSLSGIEAATHMPKNIERFIEDYQERQTLCELALLGKKAFDESIHTKWLAFLNDNAHQSEESWKQIYTHLNLLNEMGVLAVWLTFHFKDQQPSFDQLSKPDEQTIQFLTQCQTFQQTFERLTEEVQRATNVNQLDVIWEKLEQESKKFLDFGINHPRHDILKRIQFSKMLSDLINLWDINVKAIRFSKVYPGEEEAKIFKQRINQLAKWGITLCQSSLIQTQFLQELERLLAKISWMNIDKTTLPDPSFSLEHWIIPQGHGKASEIKSNDQRLTIIHQNLLQAAAPSSATEIESLLPHELSKALNIFKQVDYHRYAKRFSDEFGSFFSLSDECAKVKINIPLNYHSCVVELSQKKGSENVEINAYWRASDNDRTRYLDFLQALTHLTGITLKSFEMNKGNLKVVFSSCIDQEFTLISKTIQSLISDVRGCPNPFLQLVKLVQQFESTSENPISKNSIQEKVISFFLKQYVRSGTLPNFLFEHNIFDYYFENHPMPAEVSEKVLTKLKEKKCLLLTPTYKLLPSVLTALPEEKRTQVIWDDLNGQQNLYSSMIKEIIGFDIFKRLIKENPIKAAAYYAEHARHDEELELIFTPFITSLITDFIEQGKSITFKGIRKEQLEELTENDLVKIIWADLTGDQSIPLKEYPSAAFNVLGKLFEENRSAALSYVKKYCYDLTRESYKLLERYMTKQDLCSLFL